MIDTPHAVTPTDSRRAPEYPRCALCRDAGTIDYDGCAYPCPHCCPCPEMVLGVSRQRLAVAIVVLALCAGIVAIVGAKLAGWLP